MRLRKLYLTNGKYFMVEYFTLPHCGKKTTQKPVADLGAAQGAIPPPPDGWRPLLRGILDPPLEKNPKSAISLSSRQSSLGPRLIL